MSPVKAATHRTWLDMVECIVVSGCRCLWLGSWGGREAKTRRLGGTRRDDVVMSCDRVVCAGMWMAGAQRGRRGCVSLLLDHDQCECDGPLPARSFPDRMEAEIMMWMTPGGGCLDVIGWWPHLG